jgi:two-component system sensor histidine kinase KdpD
MTHVTVRETIPDSFIQTADEVQLIDLPPDDLLQRLADGKVYLPEQAKAAVEHFFTRSNLLSLRELALRHAVSVADEEMSHDVQQRGIKGPWPASDKVMVCVGTDPSSANLVRISRRIAERMQAKWTAVTVETPDDENRSLGIQQQLSQTLHLAEELGAEVITLEGTDIARTLVQHALANNVTDMIVGQSPKTKLWQRLPLIGPKTITEESYLYIPCNLITLEKHPADVCSTSLLLSAYAYLSLLITISMLLAAGK